MDVYRHTAAVIGAAQRAIVVQGDDDLAGVAGQCFVDAVVDNFLRQMVGAGGVGVHARTLAHRLKASEDFDRL